MSAPTPYSPGEHPGGTGLGPLWRWLIPSLFVLLAWTMSPLTVVGQEGHEEGYMASDSEAGGEAQEEHEHKNEIALVVGGTYESEEEQTLFTVGTEYSRKLSEMVSASLAVEHISDVGAWVLVAPFRIRPWETSGFFFAAGPGIEIKPRRPQQAEGHIEGGHIEEAGEMEGEGSGDENLFLGRIGIGYGFEVGKGVSITPGLDLDLVSENGEWVEAVVFDISIGLGF